MARETNYPTLNLDVQISFSITWRVNNSPPGEHFLDWQSFCVFFCLCDAFSTTLQIKISKVSFIHHEIDVYPFFDSPNCARLT